MKLYSLLTIFCSFALILARQTAPCAAQTTTPAQKHHPQAQMHRDQGDKLRAGGDDTGARHEYTAAYALDHANPRFLLDAGTDLKKIGNTFLDTNQNAQAIRCYQQALAIHQQFNDRDGQGKDLTNLGIAYDNLNQRDKAIRCYQRALLIFQQRHDIGSQAKDLANLGLAYDDLNQYDTAIRYLQQALVLDQQDKDPEGQAIDLTNLGNAYYNLSQYHKAIAYYQQALLIYQQENDPDGQANDLDNLGNAYDGLSQYEKAITYYQQALTIQTQIKDRKGQASDLVNLGIVYHELIQHDKALSCYQQALFLFRQLKNRIGEAACLTSIGNVYGSLHQYRKALASFQQALAIQTAIKAQDGQAIDLENLGNVYDVLGQSEKAIGYFQKALRIENHVKDQNEMAEIFGNLGSTYLALRQSDKTIACCQKALFLYQQVQNRDGEATTLNTLMEVWSHQANPRLAIFYGKQAVNVYQTIRHGLVKMDKQTQKIYLKDKEPTYRSLADLLIQQHRLPEALQILDMLKQEEYLNFTQNTQTGTSLLNEQAQLTPPETTWNSQYQTVAAALTTLGEQSELLHDKTHPAPEEMAQLHALNTQIAHVTQKLDETLAQIQTEASAVDDKQDRLEAQADATRLQQTLTALGHHSTAAYTLAGDKTLTLILVTPTLITAYRSPITAKKLSRTIQNFRRALQLPDVDPRPLGKELYALLVKPMEADLNAAGAQTLMWSLDGSLRYIPVAALYDGKHYLVERYTNTMFSPASDTQLTADPQPHWTGLGMGVSQPHPGFLALTNVPAELDSVIHDPDIPGSQTGALPGTILLDTAFTQAALQNGLAHHDPLVHIASHFAFQPGDAKDSFLLLGDGSHLSLADLQAMPDDLLAGVNLLTLSACETAADGAGANGKEVENLAVLAQRKGAQAVMATLWSVDDAATQQLMHDFYDDRQAGAGMTKGDALRQAQLAILGDTALAQLTVGRGPNRAEIMPGKASKSALTAPAYHLDTAHPQVHPYYWAPFILIGNWK